MTRVFTALLVAVLAVPAAGYAQGAPASEATTATAASEAQASSPQVDASKLGVSLSRIRRELREAEPTTDAPLNLKFHIEVFGRAPRYDALQGWDLDGPMPYGGPTHREVVSFLTPQTHKGQAFPISSIAVWAVQKLGQMSKKSRCEQEIAAYRELVMQGVSVAAPRCTQ